MWKHEVNAPTLSLDMIRGAVSDTQWIQVGVTTYNYLNQAALTLAAVTTIVIHQEIQVGIAPAVAAPAEPHQGGCNEFRILQGGPIINEVQIRVLDVERRV
jgi:hypothetical protein